jgi:hypothetical protein
VRLRRAWSVGRDAAESTQRVFQGTLGDARGRRAFFRLSAALNRSDLTPIRRYEFAAAAKRLLAPSQTLTRRDDLTEMVENSARDLDRAAAVDVPAVAVVYANGLIALNEATLPAYS